MGMHEEDGLTDTIGVEEVTNTQIEIGTSKDLAEFPSGIFNSFKASFAKAGLVRNMNNGACNVDGRESSNSSGRRSGGMLDPSKPEGPGNHNTDGDTMDTSRICFVGHRAKL